MFLTHFKISVAAPVTYTAFFNMRTNAGSSRMLLMHCQNDLMSLSGCQAAKNFDLQTPHDPFYVGELNGM